VASSPYFIVLRSLYLYSVTKYRVADDSLPLG